MSFAVYPFNNSLLRSGFVPDEFQSKTIKAAIAAQKDAISAIDSQIFDLEQVVDLRANRREILKKMAFNEAFLAPIRRVAPEILCQIFGYCLPPEPTQNTPISLLLTGVCHTWRRIIQETPPLWAQIYVHSRTRLSFVEMSFMNSASFPLDVTLMLVDLGENAHGTGTGWDTMEIVRVISEQHRRIRRLTLHTPYSILKTLFPSRFRTKTSLLEDLTIYCPDIPSVWEAHFRLKGGRLRTLNISGKILSTTSINRTFGLRRMSLQGSVPVSKFLQFLRVSPALEELTMKKFKPSRFNQPPDTNELDFEPIFLTQLTRLEMDWDARYYGSVQHSPTRYIRTPAATSVFFSHYPRPLDDLCDLLTYAAKSIFYLSLEGLNDNPHQFFRMIGCLSALEVLSLKDLRVKGMWEIFTPERDAVLDGWICPKLTTLELQNVDVEKAFLEFVCRRTRPIQSGRVQNDFNYLRSVVISQQYISPDISTPLGNLESVRVDFSLELRDLRDRPEGQQRGRIPYYV